MRAVSDSDSRRAGSTTDALQVHYYRRMLGNDDGLREGGEMPAGDPRGTTKQTKAHEQTPVHLRTPHQPVQVVADEVGADAKSQLPGASGQGGSGGWRRGTYESTELCDAGNTEHSTEQAKQFTLAERPILAARTQDGR